MYSQKRLPVQFSMSISKAGDSMAISELFIGHLDHNLLRAKCQKIIIIFQKRTKISIFSVILVNLYHRNFMTFWTPSLTFLYSCKFSDIITPHWPKFCVIIKKFCVIIKFEILCNYFYNHTKFWPMWCDYGNNDTKFRVVI